MNVLLLVLLLVLSDVVLSQSGNLITERYPEDICLYSKSFTLELDSDLTQAVIDSTLEPNDIFLTHDLDLSDSRIERYANKAIEWFNQKYGVGLPEVVGDDFLTVKYLNSTDGNFQMRMTTRSTSSTTLPGTLWRRIGQVDAESAIVPQMCRPAYEGGFSVVALNDYHWTGTFGADQSFFSDGKIPAIKGERVHYGWLKIPYDQPTNNELEYMVIHTRSFAPDEPTRFTGTMLALDLGEENDDFLGSARGRFQQIRPGTPKIEGGVSVPTMRTMAQMVVKLYEDRSVRNRDVVYLHQSDFERGTYIIDRPGTYKLAEDIVFNPFPAGYAGQDAYSAAYPRDSQLHFGEYDRKSYQLGFFAAISVIVDDVEIDLNGKTLSQSHEHALLQRFYANIELADQPFLPGQGPLSFGDCLTPASRVRIHSGQMGRSAHHQIHGNGNRNIVIEDIVMSGHEVAAVALNGVDGLLVRNVQVSSFREVPVVGTWTNARGLAVYADYLADVYPNFILELENGTNNKTALEIRGALRDAINNVHADLIVNGNVDSEGRPTIDHTTHDAEFGLFHNQHHVLDGNTYSFVTNKLGFAVEGFPTRAKARRTEIPITETSFGFNREIGARDVAFRDVTIVDQAGWINEIVHISNERDAATDVVGGGFQLFNLHPTTGAPITMTEATLNGKYVGNAVSNTQLLVAKAAELDMFDGSDLDAENNNIDMEIVRWAERGLEPLSDLISVEGLLCNGDCQFHVNKGVIGFKIDATNEVELKNIEIQKLENFGAAGSNLCGDYNLLFQGKSHPRQTLAGFGGAETRGVSVAGSTQVSIKKADLRGLNSTAGNAIGIDVFTNSKDVEIKDVEVQAFAEAGSAIGVRFRSGVKDGALKDFCCDLTAGPATACAADAAVPESRIRNENTHCH